MNKKKYFLNFISCFLVGVFMIFIPSSKAQDNLGNNFLLADVGIYNTEIVEQNNNDFTLRFLLKNGEHKQSDIRYGLELSYSKDSNSSLKTLVDEKVYEEVINLSENSSLTKEIKYQAPDYLKGNFELKIVSKNSNGLMLAENSFGKVALNGSNEYLGIITPSCFLSVESDDSEIRYDIEEGVVLNSEENLKLSCEIKNNSSKDLEITPVVNSFLRSTFGKKVETNFIEKKYFNINSSEQKLISFIVPTAQKPQAYDAKIYFDNNFGVHSNYLIINYTIQGPSATIQNLTLDKDRYNQEEIAKINLFLSGSADDVWGSRISSDNEFRESLLVEIQVDDNQGESCGDVLKTSLDAKQKNIEMYFEVEKNCLSPQVTVQLKNFETEEILDTASFEFTSLEKGEMTLGGENNKIILGLIVLISLLMIFLVWFFIKKRKNSTVISLLIGLVSIFGIIFCGINKTFAETYSINYFINGPSWDSSWNAGVDQSVGWNINLNKEIYAPGEKITASMNMNNLGSGGAVNYGKYSIDIEIDSRGSLDRGSGSGGSFYTNSAFAPSEPGNYQVTFKWEDRRYSDAQSGGGDFYEEIYYPNGAVYANNIGYVYEFKDGSRTVVNWTPSLLKQAQRDMGYASAWEHYQENGNWTGYLRTTDFTATPSITKVISFEVEDRVVCQPSCACDSNTCVGEVCSDGCGGSCKGIKDCNAGGSEDDSGLKGSNQYTLDYSLNGVDQSIGWNINLNKEIYAPGEKITASMNMNNLGSGDAVNYGKYSIYIDLDSSGSLDYGSASGESSYANYANVPSESGIYQVVFKWQDQRYLDAKNGTGGYSLNDFSGDTPEITKIINFEVTESSSGYSGEENPDLSKPQIAISAEPHNIRLNESFTLYWFTENANSCVAESIRSGGGEWEGDVDATYGTHQQQITPTSIGDKIYSLRCSNEEGDVLVQTTVSVRPTEYSCLGNVPENATICPNNNLEYDEYATLTDFCSPLRNCEYTCNQGYTRNANVCVRTSLPVKPDLQTNVDDLLSLNKGWNMVIFPEGEYNGVRIKKNYLESPFELLNVLEIWKYEESSRCFNKERDRSCLSVFPFKKNYGFLGNIKKNEAYWVYSSEDRTIETCDINKDNCIIPVIDNYKSVNRNFSRGFNFVNFGELNYLIEKIGDDSEISFYILNWDSEKSEWQTRNNKGENDIDYSKLEIFDQRRAYLIYIKDEFIVNKIDNLLESL